jgi:hypothetical protein
MHNDEREWTHLTPSNMDIYLWATPFPQRMRNGICDLKEETQKECGAEMKD